MLRLSWTYEIFIDPTTLRIDCLAGCFVSIPGWGNCKHATGQTDIHTHLGNVEAGNISWMSGRRHHYTGTPTVEPSWGHIIENEFGKKLNHLHVKSQWITITTPMHNFGERFVLGRGKKSGTCKDKTTFPGFIPLSEIIEVNTCNNKAEKNVFSVC